jgi:peptide chain release factor 2
MAAPSFWEDPRRAQGLVQERSDVARAVGRFQEMARQVEDLHALWDMATEAGDESIGGEIAQHAAALRRDLEAFEIKVVLSGPHDAKSAIL